MDHTDISAIMLVYCNQPLPPPSSFSPSLSPDLTDHGNLKDRIVSENCVFLSRWADIGK